MLNLFKIKIVAPAICLFGVVLFLGGCESDGNKAGMDEFFEANPYESEERSDTSARTLQITPSSAQISHAGQQFVFDGIGGVGPYSWSVADTAAGDISVRGWSQAVYTSRQVENNTVMCVDQNGHSAVASVMTDGDPLVISPDEYEVEMGPNASGYVSFYASGGTPPYKWTVASPGLGSISYSASSSHNASYKIVSGAYGVNVVTVIDADGHTASASVKQEPEEEE